MGQAKYASVVPYDPNWPLQFERLRNELNGVFGDLSVEIEHVGSTAIPGMIAKPIVDVDCVVATPAATAQTLVRLQRRGYTWTGNGGIQGQEQLDPPADLMLHQPYVMVEGSRPHLEHVLFRDYLIEHQAVALEYADLKRTFAPLLRTDRAGYAEAKASFIRAVIERAQAADR